MAPPAAPSPGPPSAAAAAPTGPAHAAAAGVPPPPVPRALLADGAVLARRYRLVAPVPAPDGAPAALWRAHDEVLARPVAVKVLSARRSQSVRFLEAAAQAGKVSSRTLTRIYDVAVEPSSRGPSVAYVISEWVDGRDLTDVLLDGPLAPDAAVDLAVVAAQALVDVHAVGLVHARLHPGNVLLDATGRLRLVDTAVAAALHEVGPHDRADRARAQEDDVRDLAAIAYALVTGRWPCAATRQPGRGLPTAPRGERGVLSPRQVLAGVPRALDGVLARALDPGRRSDLPPLCTAPALLAALEHAAREVRHEGRGTRPAARRRPGRLRRLAPYAVVLALLGVLGGVSYSVGLTVGEVRPEDDGVVAEAPAPGAAPSGAPAGGQGPVDLRSAPVAVQSYDPFGSPPQEKADQVVNATDGEPSTAWTTDRYRTAEFGGLKPGVGLLVDLGAPTALARVDVDLTIAGTELELRAGDALGADHTALPAVATHGGGPTAQLTPPPGTTARYWLVWVTRLPTEGGEFRAGVDELVLLRG